MRGKEELKRVQDEFWVCAPSRSRLTVLVEQLSVDISCVADDFVQHSEPAAGSSSLFRAHSLEVCRHACTAWGAVLVVVEDLAHCPVFHILQHLCVPLAVWVLARGCILYGSLTMVIQLHFLHSFSLPSPEERPGMSDVSPLLGISGLSFDSTLLSPLLFFCLVLLLFCLFSACWSILLNFFQKILPIYFVKRYAFFVWHPYSS